MDTLILVTVGVFLLFVLSVFAAGTFFTVKQGSVAVKMRFGKYTGIGLTGLNQKMPIIDSYKLVTTQNQTATLKFQAITQDQANVFFEALIIYATKDASEETIKKVAFVFSTVEAFNQALAKTIEGMVRSLIAGKKQQEILSLRKEIVEYVQEHIVGQLSDWGYTLHDLQVNDISFDKVVMDSMSQVVASANLKAAAENEGQALMIKKTKAAEAEGNAVVILAQKNKEAATLNGQGVAAFRSEIAKGMNVSLKEIGEDTASAMNLLKFSMWMDGIKHFAENGKGNFISLDGSPAGMEKLFQSAIITQNGKQSAPTNS